MAAVLNKGFDPGRTTSFAQKIAAVGGSVPWNEVANTLIDDAKNKHARPADCTSRYLRILYLQCYARIGDMAAVTLATESVPLMRFCNIDISLAINENDYNDYVATLRDEYGSFCDNLRRDMLYQKYVTKFTTHAETGGQCKCHDDDLTSLDKAVSSCPNRMYYKGLVEFLYEMVGHADPVDIRDNTIGIHGKSKISIEAKNDISSIKSLKILTQFTTPKAWIDKIKEIEQVLQIDLFSRHTSEYLIGLAKEAQRSDPMLAKNLRLVACYQEGGSQEAARSLYNEREYFKLEKDYKECTISQQERGYPENWEFSNAKTAYINAGIAGLVSVSTSIKLIGKGIPVHWEEFYAGMLEICKLQTHSITKRLEVLAATKPEIRAEVSMILSDFNHLMNATLMTKN